MTTETYSFLWQRILLKGNFLCELALIRSLPSLNFGSRSIGECLIFLSEAPKHLNIKWTWTPGPSILSCYNVEMGISVHGINSEPEITMTCGSDQTAFLDISSEGSSAQGVPLVNICLNAAMNYISHEP